MSTISQQLQDRRPAPFTPLAATNRYDHARFHIRVYSITCSTQRKLQEYCYDSDGTGKWAVGMSQSLDMSPCTPLAVISWYANDAPHIRVYYLSACNELQEYCFDGRWSPGALNNMHVQAAPNSSIASEIVRRLLTNGTWNASDIVGPGARFAPTQFRPTPSGGQYILRVYYQSPDNSILEFCKGADQQWGPGATLATGQ
ncbi:hypothetical protein C8Q74DRAFT_1372263 [Fomes fomentarius]|nr:hypothetical protein C8Q74DRAFT_1372263 [Fomes fomentarius]